MSKDDPKCCLAISNASFSISVNVSIYSSGVDFSSFSDSILFFLLLKNNINLLYGTRINDGCAFCDYWNCAILTHVLWIESVATNGRK